SHFEARTLPRESAGAERRQAALVRQLRQRVRLIHELAQLRRTEERLDHRRYRSRIYEIVKRDLFRIRVDRHPLLHQSRHARKAHGELIGNQLTNGTDCTVAEGNAIVRITVSPVKRLRMKENR